MAGLGQKPSFYLESPGRLETARSGRSETAVLRFQSVYKLPDALCNNRVFLSRVIPISNRPVAVTQKEISVLFDSD